MTTGPVYQMLSKLAEPSPFSPSLVEENCTKIRTYNAYIHQDRKNENKPVGDYAGCASRDCLPAPANKKPAYK